MKTTIKPVRSDFIDLSKPDFTDEVNNDVELCERTIYVNRDEFGKVTMCVDSINACVKAMKLARRCGYEVTSKRLNAGRYFMTAWIA